MIRLWLLGLVLTGTDRFTEGVSDTPLGTSASLVDLALGEFYVTGTNNGTLRAPPAANEQNVIPVVYNCLWV